MRKLSYAGTELDALKDAKNYYRWILSHFAPYVGNRIIEVGAGTGTFSEFLLNGTNASELILIEPAENLFPLLEARFSGNSRVKLVHGSLEDLSTTSFSTESVVTVNVLEHIPKDEVFLQTAHRLLVPGGTLLLFVPALPQLFGTLDEVFGHVQRYTKPLLGRKLQRAGFHLVCLRYLNSIGVIPWFITPMKQRVGTSGSDAMMGKGRRPPQP